MIPNRELLDLRGEWQLRVDVIEKDYVLGWMLAAIAAEPDLGRTWVFKGGTCVRKCYYETYRFSEDLDFTVMDGGPEAPDDLLPRFEEVGAWLYEHAGIEIVLDERAFVQRQNLRGNPTTQGRIAFRGPTASPSLAKVKLDMTSDEVVVESPVLRPIAHPYSDGPLPVDGVLSYSITELFAEKLRALAERCRPRDLYDVVHVHRHPDLIGRAHAVEAALDQKCAFVGIAVPDADAIRSSPFRNEVEQEWDNMLGHQLPHLPPFSDFWEGVDDLFAWLRAERPTPALPRAEFGEVDEAWSPPRAMASWRYGAPLELIRFAGANRMKIEIDYRADRGRWGPRIVEPYAFRRTKDGNLILFVVNDRDQLRSYRVDKIASVRITDQSFRPRYYVEF
ncbi:MAG: nucleotidyl transferase AbiEii/AbiGii toxin family protein [Actinobacteria bacterium]|nr:nucleotidyl transferase AbiEii/AbiGii toxin family protein [Actinomycetota bacterium]